MRLSALILVLLLPAVARPDDWSSLRSCIESGDVTALRTMLSTDAWRVRGPGRDTLLHLACRLGQSGCARLLVELGADVHAYRTRGFHGLDTRSESSKLVQTSKDPSVRLEGSIDMRAVWIAATMVALMSCQGIVETKTFELVELTIEDAGPESVELVEVRLRPEVPGDLSELSLNFATSESFEQTVAYRRMTGLGGTRATVSRYHDVQLSPATHELWLQVKVKTSTGQQEEQRVQIF